MPKLRCSSGEWRGGGLKALLCFHLIIIIIIFLHRLFTPRHQALSCKSSLLVLLRLINENNEDMYVERFRRHFEP